MKTKEELIKLIGYSRLYYERQWMFATAGNLSIFDPTSGLIWITASGKDKGNLSEDDFLTVDLGAGKVVIETENRPSAETIIHRTIYARFKDARACLHVHTPESNILEFSLNRRKASLNQKLPNSEILKAFGNFQEEPNLSMIVVHNFGEVREIAEEFDRVCTEKTPDVPFFLIENHGLTVWGKSVQDANKNLEAAAFIMKVMVGRNS